MIEVTTHPCTAAERLALRQEARSVGQRLQTTRSLRRLGVLFGSSVLALGIWDAAVLQFNPLRGPLVFVGSVLAASMLGLLIWKERAERSRTAYADALLKDAEQGQFQRTRIGGIATTWMVTGTGELEPGYLLATSQELCYLAGSHLLDAIEERQTTNHDNLESAASSRWCLTTEVTVDYFPQTRRIRAVVFSGEVAKLAPQKIPLEIFIDQLPNRELQEFAVLPANSVLLPKDESPRPPPATSEPASP